MHFTVGHHKYIQNLNICTIGVGGKITLGGQSGVLRYIPLR